MSKIHQAYDRARPARSALSNVNAKCMEVSEDKKYGVLWERWLLNGKSVILVSTPHWCDVFVPITDKPEWSDTITAIYNLADVATQ